MVANGISHSKSAGPLNKLKNVHAPAVSVVTFSADVATLYREQKDPEKMNEHEDEQLSAEFDENSGFAIVVNGHSLVHCLAPELEPRFLHAQNYSRNGWRHNFFFNEFSIIIFIN